jgi:hypothetical protein
MVESPTLLTNEKAEPFTQTLCDKMTATRIHGVLIWLSAAVVCSAQVEWREDLGDGYDAAMIEKPSNASSESNIHREYLRYKGKELCSLRRYSLSPDKRFVAYQESNTDNVFFLDKREHSTVELVAGSPGLVCNFDWEMKAGFLKIEIYHKETLVVPLPGVLFTKEKMDEPNLPPEPTPPSGVAHR